MILTPSKNPLTVQYLVAVIPEQSKIDSTPLTAIQTIRVGGGATDHIAAWQLRIISPTQSLTLCPYRSPREYVLNNTLSCFFKTGQVHWISRAFYIICIFMYSVFSIFLGFGPKALDNLVDLCEPAQCLRQTWQEELQLFHCHGCVSDVVGFEASSFNLNSVGYSCRAPSKHQFCCIDNIRKSLL